MSILSKRIINLFGFLSCLGLMLAALYFQYYQYLEPCPLCIFQRVGVIAVGAFFLIAAVHHTQHLWLSRVYAVLIFLSAVFGIGVAGRHVWLQSLPPDQVPECGPGLSYMLDVMPFTDVLNRVLKGSGSCADVDWEFLTLSMPTWVLIWFIFLGLVGVVNNWRRA